MFGMRLWLRRQRRAKWSQREVLCYIRILVSFDKDEVVS